MILQKNDNGIPLLLDEQKGVGIPVSFSHDDHYLGYSLYLQPAVEAIPADLLC